MTKEEKDAIFNDFDGMTIQPDEPMNLTEMKAYVKGLKMPEMQFLMLLTHFIEVIRRIETIDGRRV